jgi:spore germination protein GerM
MNGPTLKSWLISATLVTLVAGCSGGNAPSAGSAGSAATAATGGTAAPHESASPNPSAAPTRSASPAPTAAPTPRKVALKAYFLLFGNIDGPTPLVPVGREVDRTVAVARAAMEQLLAGPTDAERAHDLRVGTIGTRIPEGTRLLGLDIQDGVATVDLSSEFASGDIDGDEREAWAIRLAQVTYTLTQFPTVGRVRFMVDGKPGHAIEGHEGSQIDLATRAAYADQLPGVFVDNPAWGGAFTDPLTVSGIAQIAGEPPEFHAALVSRTTDDIVVQRTVRPTCQPGCWQPPGGGPFEFQLPVPEGARADDLMLRVWEVADDGSEVGMIQYPLH